MAKLLLILTFAFSFNLQAQVAPSSDENCKNLLQWIYRDFTLNNVDLSYQRLMQKLLISIHHANEYNKNSNKRSLNRALDEMKNIDKNFESILRTPTRYKYPPFWRAIFGDNSIQELPPTSISQAFQTWKALQATNPEYFANMDPKYKLDEWDNQTIEILGQLSNYDFDDHNFRDELEEISKNMNQAKSEILNGQEFSVEALETSIQQTNEEVIAALIESYEDNTNEFATICSRTELDIFIANNNLVCPVPKKDFGVTEIQSQLNNLRLIINNTGLLNNERPIVSTDVPPPPADTLDELVQPLTYRTSPDRRATYCKRPPEMATMLVLHHTGVSKYINPYEINEAHINDPTHSEPWHMIGYNYVISDNFLNGTPELPQVFQGRPIDRKGAHAGGYTNRLKSSERQFYRQFPILCGNEQIGFTPSTIREQMDSSGGISGNLASIGIAVSGSFTPVRIRNIAGVAVADNINRDRASLPTQAQVERVATLACSIQKKYPNVKKIVPHNYFKSTDCPAALILYFNQIKRLAAQKGCDFKVAFKKELDQ